MANLTLDATGLKCPLPVLKASKIIRQIKPGGTLEVLSTDPGSVDDFNAFCRTKGHDLLEQTVEGDIFRFLIRNASHDRAG